ncbi:hypothetical protein GQ53DRAFT_842882 [Thozetella sp. PMI_491]|nr:hypothetical protein GQ53DRAFT_842882 [Thozetella sp. PMI_491]
MAMFCSSLRTRNAWASVVTILQQQTVPRFRESKLSTHDVALPLHDGQHNSVVYRFILLSPADLEASTAGARAERLYHLDGGKNAAIVFLLDDAGSNNPMEALEKLQIEALDKFDVPIVPLIAAKELPAMLKRFMDSLNASRSSVPREISIIRELLPYCTTGKKLPERATYVLSDMCDSFRDLIDKVVTVEGRDKIITLLGEEEATRVFAFFAEEFAAGTYVY